MHREQQAVERIDTFGIGTDAPWFDMRRPEQLGAVYIRHGAPSVPLTKQIGAKPFLPTPSGDDGLHFGLDRFCNITQEPHGVGEPVSIDRCLEAIGCPQQYRRPGIFSRFHKIGVQPDGRGNIADKFCTPGLQQDGVVSQVSQQLPQHRRRGVFKIDP